MDFGRGGWGCIGVGFLVVVVREVIEGLESVGCIGMVGDAVFTCAVEILEGMDRGFVMLFAGIAAVRS